MIMVPLVVAMCGKSVTGAQHTALVLIRFPHCILVILGGRQPWLADFVLRLIHLILWTG